MFKRKTKKNILLFESRIKKSLYPDSIVPTKKYIPKWFKDSPQWVNNQMIDIEKGGINFTFKQCVPFLETMTVGYLITLPYDIVVKQVNGSPIITWQTGLNPIIEVRSSDAHLGMPIPAGCSPNNFVWKNPVSFKVPVGYSVLFTHPLNRFDLPFVTLNAIIDGGYTIPCGGNLPVYLKKDYEGIIQKGTPIAQIIPFKNENWQSEYSVGLTQEGDDNNWMGLSMIYGWYKKTWWRKKQYE